VGPYDVVVVDIDKEGSISALYPSSSCFQMPANLVQRVFDPIGSQRSSSQIIKMKGVLRSDREYDTSSSWER
jgi:hypothetical protein